MKIHCPRHVDIITNCDSRQHRRELQLRLRFTKFVRQTACLVVAWPIRESLVAGTIVR